MGSDMILDDTANFKHLVFEAQTTDVAVEIRQDDICNENNKGGGQGSVPWEFAPTTTTTTPCSWPCCQELRTFMNEVEYFVEGHGGGHIAGHREVCTDTDTDTDADTCAAASGTDCPFTDVSPGPACCGQEAVGPIWVVIMSILCSAICSVMLSTLWFQRFRKAAGVGTLGSSVSEVPPMH